MTEAQAGSWSTERGTADGPGGVGTRKTTGRRPASRPPSGAGSGSRDAAGSGAAPARAHLGAAGPPPAATPPSSAPAADPTGRAQPCVRACGRHAPSDRRAPRGMGELGPQRQQRARPPPVGSSRRCPGRAGRGGARRGALWERRGPQAWAGGRGPERAAAEGCGGRRSFRLTWRSLRSPAPVPTRS